MDNQHIADNYFLEGVIDRFEEKMAIIITKDGQKLAWLIKNLPDSCVVGMSVRLVLSTEKTDEQEREKMAKTILNKILKNDE